MKCSQIWKITYPIPHELTVTPPTHPPKKLMKINFAEYIVFDLQRWEYMHIPEPDSREAKLTEVLKNPKDWV